MIENKKICTRCGYLRKPLDDILIPAAECPKCGIIYQKFEDGMLAFDMAFNQKRMNRSKKRRSSNFAYILIFFLVFAVIFLVGFISGITYTKFEMQSPKKNTQIQTMNQN
ncbi:hypothetical protein [Desulforegula conservatrix]|uniref:hypothetical protein n=1 Tax=Desulforegula conservatrix TaxID=153026 RepID=UPI000413DF46|nr:hypothetical protein [Desulforegula conservatrix]